VNQQRTIAEKISCTGLGLHSGVPVQITLRPARINTGVVFVRRDGAETVDIPALSRYVSSTSHATTLSRAGASVTTVEHILAALHAFGVDNVRIEVDGPEVPAMDGSAASFVHLIRAAGLYDQQEERQALCIRKAIEVIDGDREIRIEPFRHFRISYAVDFEHPAIRRQELQIPRFSREIFERELARARTFGFLHEVSALRRAGLAQGGSLDNTVVLDSTRVINSDGLRWPDEFVRHKVLDMIGDLSMLGMEIQGHVKVERGGHALHHQLMSELLRRPDAWYVVGAEDEIGQPLDLAPLSAAG
jgi:UDP-3-O-[3-hydroxymyristoyl] N-acetylglucosamine deacetylase